MALVAFIERMGATPDVARARSQAKYLVARQIQRMGVEAGVATKEQAFAAFQFVLAAWDLPSDLCCYNTDTAKRKNPILFHGDRLLDIVLERGLNPADFHVPRNISQTSYTPESAAVAGPRRRRSGTAEVQSPERNHKLQALLTVLSELKADFHIVFPTRVQTLNQLSNSRQFGIFVPSLNKGILMARGLGHVTLVFHDVSQGDFEQRAFASRDRYAQKASAQVAIVCQFAHGSDVFIDALKVELGVSAQNLACSTVVRPIRNCSQLEGCFTESGARPRQPEEVWTRTGLVLQDWINPLIGRHTHGARISAKRIGSLARRLGLPTRIAAASGGATQNAYRITDLLVMPGVFSANERQLVLDHLRESLMS